MSDMTRAEVEQAEMGLAMRRDVYKEMARSGRADSPHAVAMRRELDDRAAELRVARSQLPGGGGSPSSGPRDREHHASPSRRSRSRRRTDSRAGPPDDSDPDEPRPLGGLT